MEPFIRLKAQGSTLEPETRVLKAQDYLVFQQAEQVLADAQQQAENILQQAHQEFETQKALGYEEGMNTAKLENAEQMMGMVGQAVDYFAQIEQKVVGIVIAAVRKILGEFDEQELTFRVVTNALQAVRNQKQVALRVCPAQTESVNKRLSEILSGHAEISYLEVIGDERLRPGDCILETDMGVIDASVETQLQALEKALRSHLGTHSK